MKRARPYNRDVALDAAITLFWRKGWHGTSLKDLEAVLSMKPGSIYAAFKSKEALFLEAFDRYVARSQARLEARMEAAETVLDGLAGHLRGIAQPAGDNPSVCFIAKTMLETGPGDGAIAERSRAGFDAMLDQFVHIFRRAKEDGELPADVDPDLIARRYQVQVAALRIEAYRGTDAQTLSALVETMVADLEELGRRAEAEKASGRRSHAGDGISAAGRA